MGTVLKGISDICGINFDIAAGGYKCVFTNCGAAVEGIKSIISFDKDSIILSLAKNRIKFTGRDFIIKEYSRGYICFTGTVSQIELLVKEMV